MHLSDKREVRKGGDARVYLQTSMQVHIFEGVKVCTFIGCIVLNLQRVCKYTPLEDTQLCFLIWK